VTRITLLPSAKDTPKTAEKPDGNGIPPTGPSSEPTSEEWDGLIEMLGTMFPGKEIHDLTNGPLPLSYRIDLALARIKHAFGFHTWIISEVYDARIKRLINDGYACILCEATRGHTG
jgi:hypothetical protein